MLLLVALSQSSSSLSSDGPKLDNRTCDKMNDMSSKTSLSLLHSNTFVSSTDSSSDNNASFMYNQHSTVRLEQSCMDDSVMEVDMEDSGYSDSSSVHCDVFPSFDTSSVLPIMNESINLNKHRQSILDLSISKIQMMNTSNVAVSMRKSLLIYNMMKSLQRDLDESNVLICDDQLERESEVINNDVEMAETNEFEEGNWQQLISNFSYNINSDSNLCNHRLGCDWPWDTSVNTSKDAMQGLEKYECDMFTLTSSDDLLTAENIWNGSDLADSSEFVDDYLGMLFAWEDENYNPLTNCNLTHAEIMSMFHLPSYHLNNQLVSQA